MNWDDVNWDNCPRYPDPTKPNPTDAAQAYIVERIRLFEPGNNEPVERGMARVIRAADVMAEMLAGERVR